MVAHDRKSFMWAGGQRLNTKQGQAGWFKNFLYPFGETHLSSKRAQMSQVVYVKEAFTHTAENLELIVTRLKISSLRSLLAYVRPVGLQISAGNNFQLYWAVRSTDLSGPNILWQEHCKNTDGNTVLHLDRHGVQWSSQEETVTEHIFLSIQCKQNVKTMFCFFSRAEIWPSSRIIIALTNDMDSQKDMIPDLARMGIKHCATFRTSISKWFPELELILYYGSRKKVELQFNSRKYN